MKKRAKGFLYLMMCMIGYYIFSVYILKEITHSPPFLPIQKVIEEKNIDPSVFFYSDQLFMDTTDIDVTIRHLTK